MKKKLAIILTVIAVLFVVIPFIIAIIIYESIFRHHFSAYEPMAYSRSDFPDLTYKRYEFLSKQGKKLVGYAYCTDSSAQEGYKAVIVIAHGMWIGGHINYLDSINFFAENGFLVFGYDVTGNGESEGKSVRGLPQGVMDLECVITFVENNPDFNELPVLLFGHSWGAYSVGAVLKYHPEVKAVVSFAGFNNSCDMIKTQGIRLAGKPAKLIIPYISLYERIKFGEYSSNTCTDGFARSDADVMIIHSDDDKIVPIEAGFLQYEKEFADSERFVFVRFNDKNHIYLFYTDAAGEYSKTFFKQFNERFPTSDGRGRIGTAFISPGKLTAEEDAYIRENYDNLRAHELNLQLYSRILDFYEKSLND